jgi:hypothetical protein
MALRRKPNPTFRYTVSLAAPGEGDPHVYTFIGRHKKQRELEEIARSGKEYDGREAAYLMQVLDGWDLQDAAGKELPFTLEALDELLNDYPGSWLVIFRAYAEQLPASRTKN